MKNERLLYAIGKNDDELIYDAALQEKKRKTKFPIWIKWSAAVLCLVTALFIGMPALLPTVPFEYGEISNKAVQDEIINNQEFGAVTLTSRSPAEVTALALSLNIPLSEVENILAFEDDQYIYFFYEDGAVSGIIAAYLSDNTIDPSNLWSKKSLSEEEAITLARNVLQKYYDDYSEQTASRFSVQTTHADENAYPVWQVTFTEYTKNKSIQRNIFNVNIDSYGNVSEVYFGNKSAVNDDELTKKEYITEESAVSVAINQLNNYGYEIDAQKYEVIAKKIEIKGEVT